MNLDKQSYSMSCISKQERIYGLLKFLFRINFLVYVNITDMYILKLEKNVACT